MEKPTASEIEKTLQSFFSSYDPLVMKVFPSKTRKQYVAYCIISGCFEDGICYTEKEVNEILASVHPDFATIRRGLVDYGLLRRTTDCSSYWLVSENKESCEQS